MKQEHDQGTNGRVYGGNPNVIHIDDGKRANMGEVLAEGMETMMRYQYTGERTEQQRKEQPLCPGCYMIAGFNMLLVLADKNGQSRKELALTMRNAFDELLRNPEAGLTEEMEIVMDPCDA